MGKQACGIAAIAVLLSSTVSAQNGSTASGLREAIANGTTSLRIRYRLEHVDQDGFDEQALASTALGRWTWTSAQANAWSFGLEADYVFVAGIEDFNSTTNGKSQFPIVADPEGGDLNQALLKYSTEGVTVTAGRQRINLGNQRFVGGVAFRQAERADLRWLARAALPRRRNARLHVRRQHQPNLRSGRWPAAGELVR